MLFLTENCLYRGTNEAYKRGEEQLLVLEKKELKWLGYSQPRQLIMCTSIPCFLLVQIAPTDNMWPKLNDELSSSVVKDLCKNLEG